MNSSQICILKQFHKVGFSSFLEENHKSGFKVYRKNWVSFGCGRHINTVGTSSPQVMLLYFYICIYFNSLSFLQKAVFGDFQKYVKNDQKFT